MPAIAAVSRAHCERSAASCFRPAAVSRYTRVSPDPSLALESMQGRIGCKHPTPSRGDSLQYPRREP